MELAQTQSQCLSQQQLQSVTLLQMNAAELSEYLQNLSMENPILELQEPIDERCAKTDSDLLQKLRWLNETDRQNRSYYQCSDDTADVFELIGTDGGLAETLSAFLLQQLDLSAMDKPLALALRCLVVSLESSGYLLTPLEELSEVFQIAQEDLERAREILRSLEPAGVGASGLSDCLLLQLDRAQYSGCAREIVQHYLRELGQQRFCYLAKKLRVSEQSVLDAQQVIRQLNPRPGFLFQESEKTQYIVPDILIEKKDDGFAASLPQERGFSLCFSEYYLNLLSNSKDEEVRTYLSSKLYQARSVRYALEQRRSTMLRCAQYIAEQQADFFRFGKTALRPLRMMELADALSLHPSTISRTVRMKYVQCPAGLFPMSFFFSRSIREENGTEITTAAARALIRSLIDHEDKSSPLSDQRIADLAAQQGCRLSRRTIAKYREEMLLPPAFARKKTV